ncbi:DNA-processing protein DprA [Streptomyces sp. L500]
MNDTQDMRAERIARLTLAETLQSKYIAQLTPAVPAALTLKAIEASADERPLPKHLAKVLAYDGQRALAEGEEAGARYVIPTDPEWPQALNGLGDQGPLGLWVIGAPSLAKTVKKSIAIVGSMAASDYGRHCAAYLADGLASFGYNTVAAAGVGSGIGPSALAGCAARNGTPVGVLSGGITGPATQEITRTRHSIIHAGGLLVSKHGPRYRTSLSTVVERESLIAGLSRAVTLVEGVSAKYELAGRTAERMDRPLLAVPGPITSGLSDLPNELIRQGRAKAVTSATNIIARTKNLT